jgi:hypothetical protein
MRMVLGNVVSHCAAADAVGLIQEELSIADSAYWSMAAMIA